MRTILAAFALATATGGPAGADPGLLAPGRDWREIPFSVTDLKPMIDVTVNGLAGRMMLDTGTPEPVFFNRDAAPLGDGLPVATGSAASGQTIAVSEHAAPTLEIAGQPVALPAKVRSGDFSFAEGLFGADYMGFIGTPMMAPQAFALDYGRQVLTILRTDARGTLAVAAPPPADVTAFVAFAIWPGEQPTTAAVLGGVPILVDFDTGDSGTIYLRPETRARLEAAGAIRAGGEGLILDGLSLGGARFDGIGVRAVEAGGPDDFRAARAPDFLRLGARFLSGHPSLWNFPAGTITFLDPASAFLAQR